MAPLEATAESAVSTMDATVTLAESTPLPESAVVPVMEPVASPIATDTPSEPTKPVQELTKTDILAILDTAQKAIDAAENISDKATPQEVSSIQGSVAAAMKSVTSLPKRGGQTGMAILSRSQALGKVEAKLKSHPNAPKSSQEE